MSSYWRNKVLHIVVILAAALAGFSCRPSGSNGDGRLIVFWAMGAEGERVGELMPEFERRNPGIRVKVQMIPWTAAHEKLLTAFAGSSTPDICQLGNTWIPEFRALNAIDPLDQRVAQSVVIRRDSYFPGIWETNRIDSVLYGIPWYVDTRVMFYRKDILSKAGYEEFPRTWETWYDAARKIKAMTMEREHYAMLLPTNEWAPLVALGLQNGSTLLREKNSYGDFSGEEFRGAFRFYTRFFEERLAPVGITQVTNIYQGMTEAFFSMYITGPWNIGEFSRRLPPEMQDKWMTAPLPHPTADSIPGLSLAGGASLVLFSASEQKEAAWKLIEYLSEPEQQNRFYQATGDLPARRESWQDTAFTRNVYVQAFRRQLEHVAPLPQVPEWERIAMKVQDYAEVASVGRMSVDDALRALDREADIILEKHRWMLTRK